MRYFALCALLAASAYGAILPGTAFEEPTSLDQKVIAKTSLDAEDTLKRMIREIPYRDYPFEEDEAAKAIAPINAESSWSLTRIKRGAISCNGLIFLAACQSTCNAGGKAYCDNGRCGCRWIAGSSYTSSDLH